MSRALVGLGWLTFAALIIAGGRLMLSACEVRPWPVFGHNYCPVPNQTGRDAITAEAERARVLQSRVKRAEMQLASLPACQPPPEPPPAQEPPLNDEAELKIPTSLSELKGCWVSERGDLPLVSDDTRELPMGNVRECFCFGSTGQGRLTLVYTDGVVCRGRISATLAPQQLKIQQPAFDCGERRGLLRGRSKSLVTCHPGKESAALCDTLSLGNIRTFNRDEKFQRASNDQCKLNN